MAKMTWDEVREELDFLGYAVKDETGNGNLLQIRILKNTEQGVPLAFTLQCERDNPSSFVKAFQREYEDFDKDTATYQHLDNEGHGFGNAPYHLEDVLKDMDRFQSTMQNDVITVTSWLDGYDVNYTKEDALKIIVQYALMDRAGTPLQDFPFNFKDAEKSFEKASNQFINSYGSRTEKKELVNEIKKEFYQIKSGLVTDRKSVFAENLNLACINIGEFKSYQQAGFKFERALRNELKNMTQKNPWVATNRVLKLFADDDRKLFNEYFDKRGLKDKSAFDSYYQDVFSDLVKKETPENKYELLQNKPLHTVLPTMSSTEVKVHRMFDAWFNELELNPVTFCEKYIAANNNNDRNMESFWHSVVDIGLSSGGETFSPTFDIMKDLEKYGLITNTYEEPKLYGPCYDEYVKYMKVNGTPGDTRNFTEFFEEIWPNKNDMVEYLSGNEKLLEKYRGFEERKEEALWERYGEKADNLNIKYLHMYLKDLGLFIEPVIKTKAEEKFNKNREYWDGLKSPSKKTKNPDEGYER